MKRYKLIIAYDGTDYFGWQQQKEKLAVAQALQDSFMSTFNTHIFLFGASRTDAGVHAMGQVAMFQCAINNISADKMMRAWNNVLPPSIVIRSLVELPNFNPFINVKSKTYWYHFFLDRPLPLFARYGWHYRYSVDQKALQECLNVFIGTHDFRSFCSGTDMGDDTIRRIDAATVEYLPRYKAYRIAITGPKFLRYMIRRIVGACIEVASHPNLNIEDLKRVLAAKNPEHALPKAPAEGLMLYKIVYEGDKI